MKNRANEDIFADSYEVYIELTNRCNLSCTYCYTELAGGIYGGIRTQAYDLDFGKVREMLLDLKDNLKRPWFIDLAGGEPTMYPYLIELLRFIGSEIQVPVSLYTNGTLITEELAHEITELQKTNDLTVLVSIDSFNPQHNDEERGKTEKTLSCIEILANAETSMELSLTPVQRDFSDSFRKAKEYGIQKIRVNSMRPSATGEFDYAKYRHSMDESMRDAMRHASEEAGIPVLLPHAVEKCNAGLKRIAVYADGSVSTCYVLKKATVGNIYERKLSGIIADAIVANAELAKGRAPICLRNHVEKERLHASKVK